ncbi:hypothetical protein GHT06_019780 [Daphnia sinensis]|uniref:Uncharacterized protein n=1 Tax=Daphnia sinensis TaxID=1820382 RepID=A0AAD5PPN5_9CRUS|nr:hypothetical protein GHT06_019780 [Daphnia sinensis]
MFFFFVKLKKKKIGWGAAFVRADSRREGGEFRPSLRDYKLGGFIFMAYSLASELHCRCVWQAKH